MPQDARVAAIRADAEVGRGTCSIWDEAYTDAEIVAAMDEADKLTPDDAVAWARDLNTLHWERARDAAGWAGTEVW